MHVRESESKGQTVRERLQKRVDEVKRLRDDIRSKIHLAEDEAKESFKKVEPAVDRAEDEVTRMAQDASGAVSNAVAVTLDSLVGSLRRLRARMPQ